MPNSIQTPLNILLLGVDGRKGDKNPRCDAIHVFSVNPQSQTLKITSVPRGTSLRFANLSDDTIIANACHTYGVDFAISQIEKITDLKIDYTAKVGFSQTLGILRSVGLPATESLQFLRNRHIPLGDNQRSRNQAQFMKDNIISHFNQFKALPKPIQYLAFKTIDTDMDFELFSTLLDSLEIYGIPNDAQKIELAMKPTQLPNIKEQHFVDPNSEPDSDFASYQDSLSSSIENTVIQAQSRFDSGDYEYAHTLIETPFKQQIWLQIEDTIKRDRYNFDYLKLYVLTSPDRMKETEPILDFITKMEHEGKTELKQLGEDLLNSITVL